MSTVEATDKESRAVARARKKADRIRDKHANDLPRSMQPSALVKTITIVVLVFALIYFLFPIYWAIIASTKTPSQMTGSNGLWFAVGLSDLPGLLCRLTSCPMPSPLTIPSCLAGLVATSGAGC